MNLIKADVDVRDLTQTGQIAAVKELMKLIGESRLSSTIYHYETIHGHIVDLSLGGTDRDICHVSTYVEFKDLAKLEENPWVRHISFCAFDSNSVSIHLSRTYNNQ